MSTVLDMLKALSNGGVAAAGAVIIDLTMDLFQQCGRNEGIRRDGQSDRGKH